METTRRSPVGNDKLKIEVFCPFHQGWNEPIIVDRVAYDKWKRADIFIQEIPDLNADQREILKSGICPPCWDESFKDLDELSS